MRKYEMSTLSLSRHESPSRLFPGQPGEAAWTAQKRLWWDTMTEAYGDDITDALTYWDNEIDD